MKKYFSIIAMVLIAALLVVSCTAEKANYNELVKPSIGAKGMNGKALVVDNAEADAYYYRLTNEYSLAEKAYYQDGIGVWNLIANKAIKDADGNETNAAENEAFFTTGKFDLDYISQGSWKIEVVGTKGLATFTDDTDKEFATTVKKVCSGSDTEYIVSNASAFTVDLMTTSRADGYLVLSDIEFPAMANAADGGIKVTVVLESKDGLDASLSPAPISSVASGSDPAPITITPYWFGKKDNASTATLNKYTENAFATESVTHPATDLKFGTSADGVEVPAGIYEATVTVQSNLSTGDKMTGTSVQKMIVVIVEGQKTTITGKMSPNEFVDITEDEDADNTVTGMVVTGTLTVKSAATNAGDYDIVKATSGTTAVKLNWDTNSTMALTYKLSVNGVDAGTVAPATAADAENGVAKGDFTYNIPADAKVGYYYFSITAIDANDKVVGGAVLTQGDQAAVVNLLPATRV